mmetsp:Transcript_73847/g.213721  ORF Transcript_73847/g.213721 Transcript_73847/m.213721 type:complete len:97 (+) Transcript_73847:63-353(+)
MFLATIIGAKMCDAPCADQFEKPFIEVTRNKNKCKLSSNSINVRFSSLRTNPLLLRLNRYLNLFNSNLCNSNRSNQFPVFQLRSNHPTSDNEHLLP